MNTRSHLLKLALSATLAVATLSGVGAASAADNVVPRSKAVRFADLNLSTQAGVEKLYARIRSAARTVCGYSTTSFATFPSLSKRRRQCMDDSVTAAVKQVDNTILTAMHNSKATKRRYG